MSPRSVDIESLAGGAARGEWAVLAALREVVDVDHCLGAGHAAAMDRPAAQP